MRFSVIWPTSVDRSDHFYLSYRVTEFFTNLMFALCSARRVFAACAASTLLTACSPKNRCIPTCNVRFDFFLLGIRPTVCIAVLHPPLSRRDGLWALWKLLLYLIWKMTEFFVNFNDDYLCMVRCTKIIVIKWLYSSHINNNNPRYELRAHAPPPPRF